MRAIGADDLSKDLSSNLQRVVDDRDPLVVTRAGQEAVVILAASDFESYLESGGLLGSSEDAARTRRALLDAAANNFVAHDLVRD